MLAIFFATYAAVFIAEIVGDKLLYTTGVLATRYRWGAVVIGMASRLLLQDGRGRRHRRRGRDAP